MMKRSFICLAALLISSALLTACDQVEAAEKATDPLNVTISKIEYQQLKTDAALAKQVGRYRTEKTGIRTWRLDTATGQSCLLLTSKADWTAGGAGQTACEDLPANPVTIDMSTAQPIR